MLDLASFYHFHPNEKYKLIPYMKLRFRNHCTYDDLKKAADSILSKTKYRPKIGIICGSGLGHLGELVEDRIAIPYKDIPIFPISTG